MMGGQITWSNNLVPLTFEKLDRVLMSTEWELKYPRVIVQALDRGKSDHNPLLQNTGTKS
jgi:endonuclease/exonuclease/phosphatase family metal-dependent hydrolase